MATYAIGDVQGCYDQLCNLLDQINFDETNDCLWFAGDLVNRGPKNLETLRFIKQLPNTKIVLGNHDLHLLAVAYGAQSLKDHDTIVDVLNAPDKDELCDWLRQHRILYYNPEFQCIMIHAGLPPQWDLTQAQHRANELEAVLQGNGFREFLNHMYGSEPRVWDDTLSGYDRLRFITNCFTRLRFCTKKGKIDLSIKGAPGTQPKKYIPWFLHPDRCCKDVTILFGHWASLEGNTNEPNVYALDAGCVWGGELKALRLEDKRVFTVPGLKT